MGEIRHECGQPVDDALALCPHCEAGVFLLREGEPACQERYLIGAPVDGDGRSVSLRKATAVATGVEVFVREIVPSDPRSPETLKVLGRLAWALRTRDESLPCRIDDYWIECGRLYVVTSSELPLEDSLFVRRHEAGCTLQEAKAIVVRVLEAVSRLHDLDPPVVHGDLGRDTVFETQTGAMAFDLPVTLTDFAANAGVSIGSPKPIWPPHAPPERRRLEHSPATDVFGAGLLFLELVSGKARRTMCKEGRLDKPLSHFKLEAGLEKAISSLLAADPAKRPQNARAAVEALQGCDLCSRCRQQPPAKKSELCDECAHARLVERIAEKLPALSAGGVLGTAKEQELSQALRMEGYPDATIEKALKAALGQLGLEREKDRAVLQVSPDSLRISAVVGVEGRATFEVSNAGGGKAEYRLEANRGYVRVVPDKGVAKAGAPMSHLVFAKWTAPVSQPDMSVDTGTVVLTSGDTTLALPFTLRVSPAPAPATPEPKSATRAKADAKPAAAPPRPSGEALLKHVARQVVNDGQASPVRVAANLGITSAEAEKAIGELAKRGICEGTPGGRVYATASWLVAHLDTEEPLPGYVRLPEVKPASPMRAAATLIGIFALSSVVVLGWQASNRAPRMTPEDATARVAPAEGAGPATSTGPVRLPGASQSAPSGRVTAPDSGVVMIEVDPSDAELTVGGAPDAQAGIPFRMPAGVRRYVDVAREGYVPRHVAVDASPGVVTPIPVKLAIDPRYDLVGSWAGQDSRFDGKRWSLTVTSQTLTGDGWQVAAHARIELGGGSSSEFDLAGVLPLGGSTLVLDSKDWKLEGTIANSLGRALLMSGKAMNKGDAADERVWNLKR